MAELYPNVSKNVMNKIYWDRQTYETLDIQLKAMRETSTVYVGNLSFYTTEVQIYELFSLVGKIKKVIMGLDRFKKTPCGFCFIEFFKHKSAQDCVDYINGTKLDNRMIRVELDGGFKEGRQYGRGTSGGQVRDDRRSKDDYDPGRGGFGKGGNIELERLPFRRGPGRQRNESIEEPTSS